MYACGNLLFINDHLYFRKYKYYSSKIIISDEKLISYLIIQIFEEIRKKNLIKKINKNENFN